MLTLQGGTATLGPGKLDPQGLHRTNSISPKSCIGTGPDLGAGPKQNELTFHPDHSMGAGQGGTTLGGLV